MASENKTLPKITTKNYWGIRKKLKATMPKTISKTFVAAAMNIQEASAQGNVIAPMIQMGLLDENNAPTSLANEWRDDSKYASACAKILKNVYPQELLDLAPDLETDKATIHSWISSHLMVGQEAARQSTTVYQLLLEADVAKEAESAKSSTNNTKTKPKAAVTKPPKPSKSETVQAKAAPEKKIKTSFDPNMNINIQIHISADTNADQIDKIFSSMAKHLRSMTDE